MSAGQSELAAVPPERRHTRRSWSRAEKRRIVDQAFRPGASAADVAREHGLNANQVFNWRRVLAAPRTSRRAATAPKAANASAGPSAEMLPVGMMVSTSDDGLALAPVSVAGVTPLDQGATRYPPGERTGLIEIDLICGTRLRVDASVDERALRRVLSAVKAS